MKVISLDPSLRSFGIFKHDGNDWESETIERTESDRIEILKWLTYRFASESAKGWDLMIIEDYAFGGGNSNSRSITVQAEIGGLVRGLFAAREIPIIEVPIGVWKSVTGISLKKGTPDHKSDYLGAVARKYGINFPTIDEADAFLFYQTVMTIGARYLPGIGASNIRQKLETMKIDTRSQWRAKDRDEC